MILKYFLQQVRQKISHAEPGEIVSQCDFGIEIAAADSTVVIHELQAPGGKKMRAADYLRGHPLCR